jgi:hypothetical protein
MNQDTIENHIKNLSKIDFDAVVGLVLVKVFELTAIDVDGKGDGGSDFRTFTDSGGNHTLAIQKTVQESKWEEKAVKDATTAKNELGAKRFFFLTSRAHEATALRAVENKITSTLGMPAMCLGATELAGLVVEHGLLGDFAHAIGLSLDVCFDHRPDMREIMLHSYFALSDDRHSLRTSMYDATLQSVLHFSKAPLGRDQLVLKAMEQLCSQESRHSEFMSRVDSLLARGAILSDRASKCLQLSVDARESFEVSDGIYLKELGQLGAAQTGLVDSSGGKWSQEQSEQAAVLLAQCFVQQQLQTARHASLALSMTGFGRSASDPEQALRELILASGVPSHKLDDVLFEFVDMASDKPLVKKLTRTVVHVALEGADPEKAAAIVGASRWNDVRVILDASVAIPFISASLFAPTRRRFSRGSNECIETLRGLSARLLIPWVYLNECASHLVRATQYLYDLHNLEDSLAYSNNGFVAHYYQLKRSGKSAPSSLRGYIQRLAPAALATTADVRQVMSELQPLFKDYGIEYEQIAKVPGHHVRDIQVSYMYELEERKMKKSSVLVDHDVQVLGHLRRCISEHSDKIMCLTWDGIMIRVGNQTSSCGWVVSPHEASDIVQPRLSLSQGRMTSLAHSVARTMERPAEIGGRIVDRIVQLSEGRLDDWEFRDRIKTFRDEAISRIDIASPTYLDTVELEIEAFLGREGIPVPGVEDDVEDLTTE